MLKKFLSFGPLSARFFYGSSRRPSNYFIKRLEVKNYPVCSIHIYPTAPNPTYVRKFRKFKNPVLTEVNEHELSEAFNVNELKRDFNVPVERFREELARQIRIPRVKNTLESFWFEFEGKSYQVKDLARVGKKSPSFYVMHFEAVPRSLPAALEAIRSSNLRCSVSIEGTKLHIHVPQKKKAERESLKKLCKMYLTRCKEDLYIIENLYVRNLKKQENLGFELKFRLQDQLHSLAEQKAKEAQKILGEQLVEMQKGDD